MYFPINHRVLQVFQWWKSTDCIKQMLPVGTPVLLALAAQFTAPPHKLCPSQNRNLDAGLPPFWIETVSQLCHSVFLIQSHQVDIKVIGEVLIIYNVYIYVSINVYISTYILLSTTTRKDSNGGEGQSLLLLQWQDRGNGLKLKQGRFRIDINFFFFTVQIGRHWNKVPWGGNGVTIPGGFSEVPGSGAGWFVFLDWMIVKVSSKPDDSTILYNNVYLHIKALII